MIGPASAWPGLGRGRHALKDASKALAEQVANSRLETGRLRADLVRARDEARQAAVEGLHSGLAPPL